MDSKVLLRKARNTKSTGAAARKVKMRAKDIATTSNTFATAWRRGPMDGREKIRHELGCRGLGRKQMVLRPVRMASRWWATARDLGDLEKSHVEKIWHGRGIAKWNMDR